MTCSKRWSSYYWNLGVILFFGSKAYDRARICCAFSVPGIQRMKNVHVNVAHNFKSQVPYKKITNIQQVYISNSPGLTRLQSTKSSLLDQVSISDIQDLPILQLLPNLQSISSSNDPSAKSYGSNVILQCPPGAGKTTIVPLALSSSSSHHKTIVVEPRRVATRNAALRMASLIHEPVGQRIGYAIRGETNIHPTLTVITVMTDGVLLNKLRQDPELKGIDCVILDEWHERGVNMDTALALLREVQINFRPDLKIVVMSATLLGKEEDIQQGNLGDGIVVDGVHHDDDGDANHIRPSLSLSPISQGRKLWRVLGGADSCTILKSEGKQYPITIQSFVGKRSNLLIHKLFLNDSKLLITTMADAIEEGILRAPSKGDVLAFLPGAKEIKKLVQELQSRRIMDIDIHPLYGTLPKKEQDLAIYKTNKSRRKIIVSSPIAEASLTIEGVTCVVDSGLKREPRFDPSTGLPRLVTVICSQDSAVQRAGRAGRTQEGHVIRLFSETDFQQMPQHSVPEICSTDLVPTVLLMSDWGISSPQQILDETYFVDAPPKESLHQAYQMLIDLEALQQYSTTSTNSSISNISVSKSNALRYRITSHGKLLAALPMHPRYANTIVKAREKGSEYVVAAIVTAALMDDDNKFFPSGATANLSVHVQRVLGAGSSSVLGMSILKYALRVDEKIAQDVLNVMNGIIPIDRVMNALGPALLPGFIDLVAQYKGEASYGGCTYMLSLGRSARLDDSTTTGGEGKYIVVIDTSTGDDGKTRIRSYAKISDEYLHQVSKEYREVYVVESKGYEVRAKRVVKVGHLELSSTTLPSPSSEEVTAALTKTIIDLGGVYEAVVMQQAKKNIEKILELCQRVQLAQKLSSESMWPPCFRAWAKSENRVNTESDDLLLLEFVKPWLAAAGSLKALDMYEILFSSLSLEQRAQLNTDIPIHILAPDGAHIPVDYSSGSPVASAKLQQFFGATESPSVGPIGNTIPVSLSLLSPSGKQLALSNDLKFFWKESYPAVRAEMRGRYPKHPWPDDPLQAEPSRLSKKQQQVQHQVNESNDKEKKVDKRKEKRALRKK